MKGEIIMLKYAINTQNGHLMTVEQWIIDPSLQVLNNTNYKKRYVTGICPICREEVFVKASASVDISTHFSHTENTNCPLSKKIRAPYNNIDYAYGNENINRLKEEINDNIYKIYYKCYQLCNWSLTYNEFINMCNHFKEANAINYRRVKIEYIPYILLHLAGIIRNEFFFALDYGVNRYNDLWENVNQEQIILKIDVKQSTVNEDYKLIHINGDFLIENKDKTDKFLQRETEIKSAIGIM